MSANEIQHGGQHYQTLAGAVQHWDFVALAGLTYHDGNATKYVDRFDRKNGLEDLRKADHYLMKCMELDLRPPTGSRAIDALHLYLGQMSQPANPRKVSALTDIVCGRYQAARDMLGVMAEEFYGEDL